jgi:YbbR domain-containing protein
LSSVKTRFLQWLNPVRWYQRLTRLTLAEWKSSGLKLLALLLAFILFLISRQPTSDMRLVGIPVEFTGVAPGTEIVSDSDAPQTVSVRLRGPRDAVRSLLPNQLAVAANLRNKEPGDRVVQLSPQNVTVPDSIEVLQIEPASIRLRIEKTAQKQVRVEPQFIGTPDEGVEIYRVILQPELLSIEGPQTPLNNLNHVKTESINLRGRRETFSTTVDVELPHPSLRVINRASVTLTVELGERRASRLLSNLPVQLTGPAANARLLTKTVEVVLFGPRAVIEGLRESEVRVEANLAELGSTSNTVRPRVQLPESVAKQVEVRVVNPSEIAVRR